jgi:hypothetical protein
MSDWEFRGFPQSPQVNAGITLKWATTALTHIRSIQYIIWAAKKAVKCAVSKQISKQNSVVSYINSQVANYKYCAARCLYVCVCVTRIWNMSYSILLFVHVLFFNNWVEYYIRFRKLHVVTPLQDPFKYHFMTEVKVKLHTFHTFTVDEGELPVSWSGRFAPSEEAPGAVK